MTKFLPYEAPELHERRAREVAAALLRAVGASLDRLAMRLAHVDVEAASAHEPVFEFYAEAGAPEGALYVDGKRVGTLVGVTRL
jgi:DNA repair ATPase RecN